MYWLIKRELKLPSIYCSLEAAGPVWKPTNIPDAKIKILYIYLSSCKTRSWKLKVAVSGDWADIIS